LSCRYHPDKNSDDPVAPEKFQEATFSYNILSDPDKRRQYDASGFEVIDGMVEQFELTIFSCDLMPLLLFRPLKQIVRNWSWTYQVSIL